MDYSKLTPGIYKHSMSGGVTKWDMRIKSPNGGDYLSPEVIHTIELTMNNYIRAYYSEYVVLGVFPMGCQTGFYILTRFISKKKIVDIIRDYINSLGLTFTVPLASERKCSNYKLSDLNTTKDVMKEFWYDHLLYVDKASNYIK